MIAIEEILLIGSLLILASIAIARITDNIGVPTLILFIGIGMLAGSEGPGGIKFDDPWLAQSVGIVALIVILYSGGLDTDWTVVRPMMWPAVSLATIGVICTAVAVGVFAMWILGFSLIYGLLLGAIISSTDAAAVFTVLRSREVSLGKNVRSVLELESGINDPMAVFLTIGLVEIIVHPAVSPLNLIGRFFLQMGVGAGSGYLLSLGMVFLLNRLKFIHDGLYPVFTLASACLVYAATTFIGGSGFLAVYVAGLVAGRARFVHKRSVLRFFDGLAWLSQIAMFLTLGLLVFPSRLLPVVVEGLLASGFLIFIARPLSVFLSLTFTDVRWNEKLFISWVGLRGAMPIILATFPLLARIPQGGVLFDLVFFIVITSVLVQGWTLPFAAQLFRAVAPPEKKNRSLIEYVSEVESDTDLIDLVVPVHSNAIGKPIVELGLPTGSLITMITRNDEFIVPSGSSQLMEGDAILVLVGKQQIEEVRKILIGKRE